MPLPNLELKSRQNGGGSYINGGGVQNDPGQTSYREQIRDRLQNTPRGGGGGGANNNDFKTAKIDLSLFGAASENGGGSSYYRPLSRSNMASQQRRAGGGANINGNGASSNSYANSNRASMSNMKRQIVFYNKTYVPSSSDGNNNNDAADDNNDIVTTSNHNNQRRTSHRLSVNNDANENDLLSTSTRLNNSRDFYSKNNDDYFQSKSRHKNRGDGGGKSNVLVLDRINQLSIDNTNNNRRPEPMPRQRNNNNNNNTNMTNEQPMGSRPNSRQQNHRSSHQQPLKPLSQQQQQRQQNEAFETTRSTIRRQRVQSNSNGDVSDIIGGNDANGDNEMFSYVIDHFKPPNNNNFENDVFGDDRFEVESVRDNETPVPKPRKFMQQSQQTPLVPSKISLRYELADSSGQNNTADAINLRMRRSTNNRPITPRTGPFTSSRQVDYQ